MREVKSCGVLVMRRSPELSFLLMRHADRWDLPKGHVDPGEGDIQCALRELTEETGIQATDIALDPNFQCVSSYLIRGSQLDVAPVQKTLLIYLGWLERDVPIQVTEHLGFEWFRWAPPHHIQTQTIDPLLAAVDRHFQTELPNIPLSM